MVAAARLQLELLWRTSEEGARQQLDACRVELQAASAGVISW